jgi:hypothetical protein
MKNNFIKWICFICIFFIAACSGTKITRTNVNPEFKGNPVSNILVIAIADKPKVREAFENKFVQQLKASGISAVSSVATIPMPPDLKLKKEDILNVVKKYNNDAVIITFLKSVKDKDVRTRDAVSLTSFYSYYGFAFGYAGQPHYSSINTNVFLETRLYDVKTEQLMWTGYSQSLKIESVNELINDVIHVVIEQLQKDKLIVKK